MKTRLLALSAVVVASTFAYGQNESKKDLDKFQGNWVLDSVIVEGQALPAEVIKGFKMTFKGDTYSITIGQDKTEGSLTLDPTRKPKTIDIVPDNGPDRGRKQAGIYEFDGDKIKICAAQPGKERPKNFETKDKVGYTLMVLRREK